MKKRRIILIFICLISANFSVKTQDTNFRYIPLLDTNKNWIQAMRLEFGGFEFRNYYLGDENDTLIHNDTVYKKLYFQNSIYTTLREDTIEKKVYKRDLYKYNWDTEQVLYDFNLQPGDTFYYYDNFRTIDSVKYQYFFGIKRKVIYFNNPDYFPPVWIEGVGSVAGLFEPTTSPGLYGMGEVQLNCCYEKNIKIYESYWANQYGCYFEDLKIDEKNNEKIIISPNPVIDVSFLSIPEFKEQNKYQIYIYNSLGNLLITDKIQKNNYEISKSQLSTGIYFIIVKSENQIYYTSKFVIL